MDDGIPSLWMRGGTSKGACFLASDLPADPVARDALLLRIFGSPDPRQIDGIGGADPLTSKVAILTPPSRPDADVDYLFLQVFVDQALVSGAQGCGNILAGDITSLRIHMLNTGEVAATEIRMPGGRVTCSGNAAMRWRPAPS